MRWVVLVAVGLVLTLTGPAVGADGAQDRAADLATELMSPFCPGLTIHDCPTQEADELRAQIVTWAERGWSNQQIVERLESEYGPSIRAIPDDGSGWLVWAIPLLALGAGIVIASFVARRWTRDEGPPEAGGSWANSTPEERERLETELRSTKRDLWGRT